MKRKILLTILAVMLACQSAQSQMASSVVLRPQLDNLASPDDLSKYMRKHFKFVEDMDNFGKVDYWQSPEEMLTNKKGDCEDFALFAHAVLQEMGFESYVVSMYGKDRFAHTIAIFKQDGKYRVFNDGKLYKYDTENIEDILSRVEPKWIWAAFTERKNERGWIEGIFYNPSFQPRRNLI